MRRRHSIAILIALGAAACERATAPQATAKAEQLEQQLVSGDISQLQGALSDMLMMASSQAWTSSNPLLPSTSTILTRNGRSENVHATVLERVYLPPRGSGGRPLSRKTVLVWGEVPDMRGIPRELVMMTSDSASSLAVPSLARAHITKAWSAIRDHAGFVINVDPNDRRAWYGSEGVLRVVDAGEQGPCPLKSASDRRRIGDVEVQLDTLGLMPCDARSYDVSMSAFLLAGNPDHPSTIQSIAERQANTIRFPTTRVPGIRLVTQCLMSGRQPDPAQGCWMPLAFWVSNDQFDPSLGVDLSAMKPLNNDDLMMQTIAPGAGAESNVLMSWDGVSILARAADGTVVYRNERLRADTSMLWGLVDFAEPKRVGKKVRFLTWARRFDPSAPPAKAVIVDVEFLPYKGPAR